MLVDGLWLTALPDLLMSVIAFCDGREPERRLARVRARPVGREGALASLPSRDRATRRMRHTAAECHLPRFTPINSRVGAALIRFPSGPVGAAGKTKSRGQPEMRLHRPALVEVDLIFARHGPHASASTLQRLAAGAPAPDP